VDAAGSRRACAEYCRRMLWPLFAIAVSASPQVVRAMKHDVSFELRALPQPPPGLRRARRA